MSVTLKKIGRMLHLLTLLKKKKFGSRHSSHTKKKIRIISYELVTLDFLKYYNNVAFFEKMFQEDSINNDFVLEYYKWKTKNWFNEYKKNIIDNLSKVSIKCKICLTDVFSGIFREHSLLCKEKGILTSKINKMRKNSLKFSNVFQEIRLFLITKTKMDM